MASRASAAAHKANKTVPIDDYEHAQAKRTNNPPSGLAHLDREVTPTRQLSYDPHLDPQLGWAGKAERQSVDIPAPSIHVHEELSAQRIIGSVRRQRTQAPLFDIDALDPADAVDFYQHDLANPAAEWEAWSKTETTPIDTSEFNAFNIASPQV